jgi:hypothetical protein
MMRSLISRKRSSVAVTYSFAIVLAVFTLSCCYQESMILAETLNPEKVDTVRGAAVTRTTFNTPTGSSEIKVLVDDLCSGCRLASLDKKNTCDSKIDDERAKPENKNKTTVDLAKEVALAHPTECHRCDPDVCPSKDKKFLAFDEAGPRVIYCPSTAQTHYLRSVPAEYRLPLLDHHNFFAYFNGTNNNRKKRLLWEFNPSVALLPTDQIPDDLRSRNESFYLAIFRLSHSQNCFTDEQQEQVFLGSEGLWDLTGFAILDMDLNIRMETIVSLFSRDHRLFNLNDQLYVGNDNVVAPMWLKPPVKETVQTPQNHFRLAAPFTVSVRKQKACCSSETCKGKNFNYFTDHTGRILVETSPFDPRIVEVVDMEAPCTSDNSMEHEKGLVGGATVNSTIGTDLATTRVFITDDVPPESFHTIDEVYFPTHGVHSLPYTAERGTACCVAIPDVRPASEKDGTAKDLDYLLVGVSHFKIPHWSKSLWKSHGVKFASRQYTSRLYAFEPTPPYRVVARSGSFCMGFPDEQEGTDNPNMWIVRNRPAQLGNQNMTCPYITFVMGVVEAFDDPSKVIISYGMNDCAPRIVKVDKSELVQMLFPTKDSRLFMEE